MKVDLSELRALIRDINSAPRRLNTAVLPIMKRAGGNVQRDAKERVKVGMYRRGRTRLPHYPRAITFTTTQSGNRTQTDVGPENLTRKQGALGRGVEFGSVKTPAIPHMIPAAEAEAPRIRPFLVDAAAGLLRR